MAYGAGTNLRNRNFGKSLGFLNIDTRFKKFSAQLFYKLFSMIGGKSVYNHADFRLMSKRAVEGLRLYQERNLYLRGIVPELGFEEAKVTYSRKKRFAGETKYPFRKMFEFAVDGLTSFSVVPLRICSMVGLLVSLLALLMLSWSIVVKIFGGAIPGWTSTVAPLYLLGGVQLLFLGIVGEYIGKIYTEVKNRPRYIVQETINLGEKHVAS